MKVKTIIGTTIVVGAIALAGVGIGYKLSQPDSLHKQYSQANVATNMALNDAKLAKAEVVAYVKLLESGYRSDSNEDSYSWAKVNYTVALQQLAITRTQENLLRMKLDMAPMPCLVTDSFC